MQFSDTLEVAIGLSFVFLLLSLIMTALQESVESLMKVRSKRLFQGFIELLNDPQRRETAAGVVKVLYEHPLARLEPQHLTGDLRTFREFLCLRLHVLDVDLGSVQHRTT